MIKHIMKRILSLCTTLIVGIFMIACPIYAEDIDLSAMKFGTKLPMTRTYYSLTDVTGSGTESSPYLISTAEQLQQLATDVNGGNTYSGTYFKLTQDIDLSSVCSKEKGSWTSIGNFTNKFSGTFDGCGYKISGLYINSSSSYQGLFGYLDSDGTIKNLGIVNSNVTATGNIGSISIGGLCGNNSGTIEKCYNTGNVTGNEAVGGVCGNNTGTIKNCYNTGTVTGSQFVGGMCGYSNGTIENCHNIGTVTGTSESLTYIGSVCGYNYNGIITNCYYLDTTTIDTYSTSLNADGFKDSSNFENWDFTSTWTIDDILGRPVLIYYTSTLEIEQAENGISVVEGQSVKLNVTSGTIRAIDVYDTENDTDVSTKGIISTPTLDGSFNALKSGTVYIKAYNNDTKTGTPVIIKVDVSNYEITNLDDKSKLYVGDTFQLESNSQILSCESDDTSVATVTDDGKIVARSEGIVNITIRDTATKTNTSNEDTITIMVVNPVDISFKNESYETEIDKEVKVEINVDATVVEWKVLDNNGKTVTGAIVESDSTSATIKIDKAGEYNVSATNGLGRDSTVALTVIKLSVDTPTVTIESKTTNTITVTPLPDTDTYGSAEYSIDGETWQTSNVFENLQANTEYTIYARYSGNDTYATSSSGTITETTYSATYTITIESNENGSIFPQGEQIIVEYLQEQTYTIVPNLRYAIDKVFYNGQDVTSQLINGTYTAEKIYQDGTLTVTYRQLTEKSPLSENPIEWNSNTNQDVTIELSDDFGEVTKVIIDGEELSSNDYSITTEPLKVVIKSDYLGNLEDGEHTIYIESSESYTEINIIVYTENIPTKQDILRLKKYILGISQDTSGLDFNDDQNVNILDFCIALNRLIND